MPPLESFAGNMRRSRARRGEDPAGPEYGTMCRRKWFLHLAKDVKGARSREAWCTLGVSALGGRRPENQPHREFKAAFSLYETLS